MAFLERSSSSMALLSGARLGRQAFVVFESGQQKMSRLPGEGIPPGAAGRSRAARRPCTLLITDLVRLPGSVNFRPNSIIYTIAVNGLAMYKSAQ
jgi:hypothetical protein